MTAAAIIEIADLVKEYRGLRPLRIEHLRVAEAERVALAGFDAPSAEVLVSLITGAHLPDRGTVRVFGQATSDIADGDAWMASLDRFGIVSDRSVLLEAMSVEQNIALSFSLEIDPVPPETRTAVAALAREVGLDAARLETRVAEADALTRARVNLARAVALRPSALLLEHAAARLPASEIPPFARDLVQMARSRRLTVLAITADARFGRALDARVLTWDPASGRLRGPGRRWFGA